MSAILVPGVTHRLLSGKSRTALSPQIINVHTMVWSLQACEDYFAGKGRPYSHFGTGPDGEIRQWQDLRYRAASCYYGNPYNISIENADKGAGYPSWTGTDVPRFTDAQAESLVVLISWLCHRFGLPKSAIATSRPHERGIGWHRLGVNPYRHPDGRLWSSAVGKACPGDRRIHQLVHEIIPAVSAPAPQPPEQKDEEEMVEDIERLHVIYLKANPDPRQWSIDMLKSFNYHLWRYASGSGLAAAAAPGSPQALEQIRQDFQKTAGL